MPLPAMQLQNLGFVKDLKYIVSVLQVEDDPYPEYLQNLGFLDMPVPYVNLQNLGFMEMPAPYYVKLQNLGFLDNLGDGLESAAKYGSKAYKVGKTVAPHAGQALKIAAPEHYEKYAVPATEDFLKVKDLGKSKGGWNEVDKIGK